MIEDTDFSSLKNINLPTPFQQIIHQSKYARWLEEEGRRETWFETIMRYILFFKKRFQGKVPESYWVEVASSILNLEVFPSMRALWSAGKALERDEICNYNCSYLAVNNPRAFSEAFYLLLCGCGVGFGVERQEINKLPEIPEELFPSDTTIIVKDSKLGWVQALNELVSLLYSGRIPKWDLSLIRPTGSRLKTFGGRASGPRPLNELFNSFVQSFKNAKGRRLNSFECHCLMTDIAATVQVGGSRRSALISLSNLSDERMRDCKSGQWWERYPNLSFANNSVAYTEKPDIGIFMKEWLALYMSKSGERGIFNRQGAKNHIKKEGKRDWNHDFGLNPCGEVLLRNRSLCNLSSTIIRQDDTFESIKKKLSIATFLGTIQSDMVNFRFLSKDWKKNCLEEHLLGVSLTGIMDHPFLSGKVKCYEGFNDDLPTTLRLFKEFIYEENERFSEMLGISPSVSVTVIKPEGNSSSLNNTSPGIHPRFSPYYIRSIRFDNHDPLAKMLAAQGVRNEPDIMKPETTTVFYFPVRSPDHAVFVKDVNAIEQLELYKIYKENYTSHNPSITVYVKEHEWLEVGAWVYKNFDIISGVSFLPNIEHSYSQLPYEEVSEEVYLDELSRFPIIDWSKLSNFEKDDNTTGGQEYACLGGACLLD